MARNRRYRENSADSKPPGYNGYIYAALSSGVPQAAAITSAYHRGAGAAAARRAVRRSVGGSHACRLIHRAYSGKSVTHRQPRRFSLLTFGLFTLDG